MSGDSCWRTQKLRESVIKRFNVELFKLGTNIDFDCGEIERRISERATTKEEYLGIISKLTVFIRMRTKNHTPNFKAEVLEEIGKMKIPKLVKVVPIVELEKKHQMNEQDLYTSVEDVLEQDN
ncbi:unnamed protein product [Phyllotreta striolata]|uniref:Mediator of RNA polymerase II transcription subunit 15 n=1 Tax=Phyllotreta striolata TaxID=444603 RepID=A0A9N9TS18_PHYSR|nr:unnamed protein product [Phyllotreta striolata]